MAFPHLGGPHPISFEQNSKAGPPQLQGTPLAHFQTGAHFHFKLELKWQVWLLVLEHLLSWTCGLLTSCRS